MIAVPQWFIFLLIGNCLVVLVYSLLNLFGKEEKNRSWAIRAAVMLLCPLVGVCFFLVSWLLYRLVFRTPVDLSDVVFNKDRVESAAMANEELERNFVPLEEAIVVTDKKNLRELMLNVVREDYQESLASIALALNSEDTEISHYAASVLQGALNDFRVEVQKNYQSVMDDLDELEVQEDSVSEEESRAAALLERVDEMLKKRVLTDLEQAHYARTADEVAEKLFSKAQNHMDCGMMEEIALRLLEVREYEKCEKWALRIAEIYPDTLCAFTCRLKLYFSEGKRELFFDVLNELRQTDIVIDKETLELIRVFN